MLSNSSTVLRLFSIGLFPGPFSSVRYRHRSLPVGPTDRLGPDDLLIRVNEDSILAWLTAKVERATKRFAELAMRCDAGVGNARPLDGEGFAAGFTAIVTTNDPGRQHQVAAQSKQQALEAVCEYLDDDWARKLAEKFR